jgi:Sulfotransferase family
MKIIFLHLPKTAGQSVHQFLIDFFGEDKICPARNNEQLLCYSKKELNKYQVFSGHFDWCLLDTLSEPKFTFTVLREPRERIFSFYFYLRKEAEELDNEELKKVNNEGLKAALTLSPYDYFVNPKISIRDFIDDHYDNFYTYYFAGRSYNAHSKFKDIILAKALKNEDIFKLALDNISTLDKVYTVSNWESNIVKDLAKIMPTKIFYFKKYLINENQTIEVKNRLQKLKELGGNEEVIKKIDAFCKWDDWLYKKYLI